MNRASFPALVLLWWLKTRGRIRLLARRAKTPGGAISLFIGVSLLGLWIASIVLRSSMMERTVDPPSVDLVRLGLLAYLGFVAFSSLSFRGVYMPRAELERLFAAPVERRSLLRFRMLGAMLMALPFTAIVSLFLSPRFASPAAATLGLAFTIPAMSIFGQSLSLLAARSDGLLGRMLERVPPVALRILGGVGILGLFIFLAFGPGIESSSDARFREMAERYTLGGPGTLAGLPAGGTPEATVSPRTVMQRIDGVASSTGMRVLTLPLAPWARAVASPSVPAALPWLGLVAGLLVVLFEGVARLPIDFRESSLRTSRDVEKRLSRLRSGQGGAGAFGLSNRTKGWRIPWLAGRGPFGAMVWVRTAWLARQARGTLFIVLVVAILGVVAGVRIFDQPGSGPATLGLLATVYLASGVRADFRTDLDRMESMRAWPLAPWKVFVGTLLPGVTLTTLVVAAMLLARASILQQFGPDLWLTIALVPFLSYVWTAVDNSVFLLFPVRFIPGQGSALQHTGRGFLLVLLRGLMLVGALALAGGGAYILWVLTGEGPDGNPALGKALALGWTAFTGCLLLALLTSFGAWALARFDVSRIPAPGG